MIAPALLVAALGVAAAPPAAKEPAADRQPAPRNVALLWVRTQSTPYPALAEEIALRLPEVRLVPYGTTRPDPGAAALLVFVDVRTTGDTVELTLVASDGRAFDRRIAVEADADANVESVARNVANLVFGIESGTVQPDRSNVELPKPEAEPEPCPTCPDCPEPATNEAPEPKPQIPRFELGPAFSFGVLTGLGPPSEVDRFAAWGGGVDLGFRLRNGVGIAVGFHPTGRGHPRGDRLLRLRITVGAGYVWRPPNSAFELAALAGVSVEPWLVLRGGAPIDFGATSLPTVGGWARLAPGYLVRSANRRIAARIGAFGELGVAYVPAADGLVLIQDQEMGELFPMFRVGGPEVTVGFQTRLWFAVW